MRNIDSDKDATKEELFRPKEVAMQPAGRDLSASIHLTAALGGHLHPSQGQKRNQPPPLGSEEFSDERV